MAFHSSLRPPPSSLTIAERSHSGLVHRSRKPEWVNAHRGFESHPLRHIPLQFKYLEAACGPPLSFSLTPISPHGAKLARSPESCASHLPDFRSLPSAFGGRSARSHA